MKATVEICVEGVVSAIAAATGGADRIELCENLAVGGVTPSSGAIWSAKKTNLSVHVLIRPRRGDFRYQEPELYVMHHDIVAARMLGASAVVLGILGANRRIDRRKMRPMIEVARPMSVTFHKAFDNARDPFEALDDLIELGVDRVLTSGGSSTAREGLPVLAELARRSAGRIAVMAGGSIRREDIRPLIEAGLREIHIGSAACRDGVTDSSIVRELVEEASMTEIFHITTRDHWERAQSEGVYRADSLATEGFIHASNPGQVAGSANRFFRGRSGLVLLRIDPDRVAPPIRREPSPDSDEPFPHIYGPLNLDAVVEVVPLDPDGQGAFRWPDQPSGTS
jgi:copper homeostasis protein